jgi:2,3-bisphosphoglycerate-dependent phosphoglycerate mutase
MPQLALVRHGQSLWNLENRFTGWVDVPLTPQGEDEARAAGERLAGRSYDVAYTSVLTRAQRTLDLMLETMAATVPIIRDQALNERHYGDLQGLNKADTAARYGDEQVHVWRRSYATPPPNGEALADTAARTMPFFERAILGDIALGKDVLVARPRQLQPRDRDAPRGPGRGRDHAGRARDRRADRLRAVRGRRGARQAGAGRLMPAPSVRSLGCT